MFWLVFAISVYAAEPIHCQYDHSQKIYLENDFQAGYPRDVVFQCRYDCWNTTGMSDRILATHKVRVADQEQEALRTACEGVKLKKSKWGYEHDSTSAFYAHLSRSKEVKSWASRAGRNQKLEERLRTNLVNELEEVIAAFRLAGQSQDQYAPTYQQAAWLLVDVQKSLRQRSFHLLDAYVQTPAAIPPYFSANVLVANLLNNLAYWRWESSRLYFALAPVSVE